MLAKGFAAIRVERSLVLLSGVGCLAVLIPLLLSLDSAASRRPAIVITTEFGRHLRSVFDGIRPTERQLQFYETLRAMPRSGSGPVGSSGYRVCRPASRPAAERLAYTGESYRVTPAVLTDRDTARVILLQFTCPGSDCYTDLSYFTCSNCDLCTQYAVCVTAYYETSNGCSANKDYSCGACGCVSDETCYNTECP